jgi:hypothetical protein
MTTPPAPATNPIYDFTGQVARIAGSVALMGAGTSARSRSASRQIGRDQRRPPNPHCPRPRAGRLFRTPPVD